MYLIYFINTKYGGLSAVIGQNTGNSIVLTILSVLRIG